MPRVRGISLVLASALLAPLPGPEAGRDCQTIVRRYTPADRDRERYTYVPFDVSAGTTVLRVQYAYDREGGRNTIDLGLFEPGPLTLGTAAMRGYSGGSKSEVTLDGCTATPGYRAGPLPAGRWHVMLGLYQVAPAGVDVTLTISQTRGTPCARPRAAGSVLGTLPDQHPLSDGPRWWSGALHVHTVHSDGAETPLQVLRRAEAAGLDFVAITDHNNTTHRDDLLRDRRSLASAPLPILGEEVTTPAGHANVWGLDGGEWVDFRVRPQDRRISELTAAAHRFGALFSINHPVGECAGCSWEHDWPDGLDAMEIWNGSRGPQDGAVQLWDRLLRQGQRVTGVGASDWHREPDPIDRPHVRVLASRLDERAILEAIRRGRVIVMRDARDETPHFTVTSGGRTATVGGTIRAGTAPATLEVVAAGLVAGRVVTILSGVKLPDVVLDERGRARYEHVLKPGFVRWEVFAADGTPAAIANPVWVTP